MKIGTLKLSSVYRLIYLFLFRPI